MHHLFKLSDQSCGDRSNRAITDGSAVDGYHRDDLCGATGEEAFVGHQEIVAGHGLFVRWDIELPGQLKDRVARDPFEDPGVFGRG